jgi:hypothetical protein
MVGPEGLERQRPTVFDLPIMSRAHRAELRQKAEENQGVFRWLRGRVDETEHMPNLGGFGFRAAWH